MNYKSYGFWTALAGAVVMLLQALGECFGFTIDNEVVTSVIMAIAGLLVVLGVVSMPKSGEDSEGEENGDADEDADENTEENKGENASDEQTTKDDSQWTDKGEKN